MCNIFVRSTRVGITAVAAWAVVGCGGGPRPTPVSTPAARQAGGTTSSAAVEAFLRAAQGPDANAMSGYFGTRAGPTTLRDPAADVEKRMIALACYLRADTYSVLSDVPGVTAGNDRTVTAELRQRDLVRRTRFTVVPGPGGRWFVNAFDIDAVSDLCRPRG